MSEQEKIVVDGFEFSADDIAITEFDMADYLTTEDEIARYLKNAAETGDNARIMQAFDTVARARGGVGKLAKDTGLNRETLYKTLSGKSSPRLDTLLKLANAYGLMLTFAPKPRAQHANA